MLKSETARQYRRLNKEMNTLKLARIMYAENKALFKDVEDARKALRYIEGKLGKKNIYNNIKKSEFFMAEERPRNPYKLPDSDQEIIKPYFMPFHKKVLILNDIHLPYHDIPALTAAIDFGKHYKPDAIFLNGDILDIHSLSYFMKDPRKKNFAAELDIFENFMAKLNKIFKCKIYFKFGNHEQRYENYLFQKSKELVGVKEFELKNIIKKRADCEIITDNVTVVINNNPFVHGHEFGRTVFSPVNAARGLFMQAKHSAVKGDCHTTSEHTEPDIFGKIMTTYSVGCLCGLTPQWLPLNKWNHGVAAQDNKKDGTYSFINKKIYDGKVL